MMNSKTSLAAKILTRALLLAAGLSLAACSTQAATETPAAAASQAPGVHPESGLEVIDLTVTSARAGAGGPHRFRVEVAATPQQQQRGLMFRTAMGANEGMIFPFPQARIASFWMRNTVIGLDIIFIGPDNRVLNVAANAVPYSEESIPAAGPTKAVLELNAGRAAELGIAAGDLVAW
jgi:uncharacterized membrane protein (UPF0127 family)